MKTRLNFTILLILLLSFSTAAQTGGTFDLSHNVIASGGGSNSTGGSFKVDGTIGQNIAGTQSTSNNVSLRGGFWAFQAFAPTVASASISGRIRTADGRGIRNVRLVLANPTTGEVIHAISSSFGYYRFEEITVGQTYILTVSAKRFAFDPDTRVITLLDELTDVDFTALEDQRLDSANRPTLFDKKSQRYKLGLVAFRIAATRPLGNQAQSNIY